MKCMHNKLPPCFRSHNVEHANISLGEMSLAKDVNNYFVSFTYKHDISTTMNVEVVAPNHLRILDDFNPPYPSRGPSRMLHDEDKLSMENSSTNMEDNVSNDGEKVVMVGETQNGYGAASKH
ncbi:DNA phosphorothioation-dependent restriction protein DptH [Sesbania bispinosa]|nr:DNA phosphorothioation-dependent restriction protein DptH [Sesbania bispinosa]